MPTEKVLIVDDERLVRWSLRQKCEEWGYHTLEAETGSAALKIARNESPDLVLLDVRLPDISGIQLLEQLKQSGGARAVIMITADPQLEDVKLALKLGAFDFIGKPLDFEELEVTMRNALETTRLRTEVESLRGEVRRRTGYHDVIGVSPRMTELMGFVRKIADSEATTILIQGESGTGKDLIAKAIHYQSRRQDKSFVAINCSAIPETLMEAELFGHERGAFTDAKAMKKGLFEMADGGTLFLDEIGELPLEMQAKLLRVLQEKEVRPVGSNDRHTVDVRVIAATNRDLESAYRTGTFRKDLYFRLNVVTVHIPPLRERRADIPMLVHHFLNHYTPTKPLQVTAAAMKSLLQYDWPGNVRELENCIARAVTLGDQQTIDVQDLPPAIRSEQPATSEMTPQDAASLSTTALAEMERMTILRVFEQAHGDKALAGKMLGISRATLYRKLKRYNIALRGNPEQGEKEAAAHVAAR